jgi:hypothetical protein
MNRVRQPYRLLPDSNKTASAKPGAVQGRSAAARIILRQLTLGESHQVEEAYVAQVIALSASKFLIYRLDASDLRHQGCTARCAANELSAPIINTPRSCLLARTGRCVPPSDI